MNTSSDIICLVKPISPLFKKLFLFVIILLATVSGTQKVNAATTATVSAPTIVATPTEIYAASNPFNANLSHFIDSPLTTFVSNGTRYWIDSLGAVTAKYSGTLAKPFQTFLWAKNTESYFIDPKNLLGGPWRKIDNLNWTYGGGAAWIVNLYQVSNSELLAFVHIEQSTIANGVYTTGRSSMGLAWSNNSGESFTYLGDIIKFNNFDNRAAYNVQGSPFFIKDGYFYLYYHDLCPTTGSTPASTIPARAPVTEVINAARSGQVSSWKKYYNGGFTSNGLGGPCSKISIANGVDHTDAAYSAYTQKYYITLSSIGTSSSNSWINLFESTDGINWTFLKTIVNEPIGNAGGFQYVSILDSNGNDNGTVGQSFYVYSARNHTNASIYRWLVTLQATAPSPTPTVPSGKPGDVNSDGLVNIIDIGVVIDNYGKTPITNPKADVNRDGLVNIIDIGMIIDNYGK